MRRLTYVLIILLIALSNLVYSGNCKIQGLITDSATSEPLPFVNIILMQNGKQVSGVVSDFDGNFVITPIDSGTYSIRASSVGFQPKEISNVQVKKNRVTQVNIKLRSSSIQMQEFVVVQHKHKLINRDKSTRKTVSSKLNIRGSRADANYYYVDGMKVLGSHNQPINNEAPIGSEGYESITDNVYSEVRTNPLSTFSIDVDKASYANVRRFINQGFLPPADAVRIEEMVNYFNYYYPQPTADVPFSITTEYTSCPWNPSHKLVHIGIQGKEIEMENAPSNNLVFLIDVSGSMSAPNKLGLVKTGLNLLVDQLRKEDRVAIVVYAGAAGLVLPSTSGAEKQKIKQTIMNLNSGGSTAGGAGIQLAYKVAKQNFIKDGNNRIILASDGDFNVGISSQSNLIKLIESKRNDNIFLTTLGFGSGNLQDAKMEQLANKGNGNYNYIDNALEAKKVFVSELGGNLITIAKDVKIQVEFNPSRVKSYRLIGYVNRKLNNEDFNDDTKDAGEIGAGHNVTMMYEIIPSESDEEVFDIDELKYQKDPQPVTATGFDSEVLTVKCRYKEPKGTESMLISHIIKDTTIPFSSASNNCRFSASVASFGMLLRKSSYTGNFDYESIIHVAESAKGSDEDGSRSEFIQLVKMVAVL